MHDWVLLLVDAWTVLRRAGELVDSMGSRNLDRRSIANSTPLDFEITNSDALPHLQAREIRFPDNAVQGEVNSDQIVRAALEDKVLVWYGLKIGRLIV